MLAKDVQPSDSECFQTLVPQRLLAVAELAMELEQQTQLRKVDMETNHMAAAVRKIYPSK